MSGSGDDAVNELQRSYIERIVEHGAEIEDRRMAVMAAAFQRLAEDGTPLYAYSVNVAAPDEPFRFGRPRYRRVESVRAYIGRMRA